MLIDSHCHLDFEQLNDQLPQVLARMHDEGVAGCVTISTRVRQFDKIKAIAEAHDKIWCSVGTHPHNADEETEVTADELIALAQHPKCVAIGEAGLDYHYDYGSPDAQAKGFRRHIEAARQTGLPLVIHTRSADADTARILEEETRNGAFPFILHCFSSGAELARRGLDLGGYVSFSGILTFKNAEEIREVARFVPDDRLLVETDAPYLAPVPHRGQSNEPSYVVHTARKLAETRDMSFEQIARLTTANFARLFSKSGLVVA